MRKTIKIKDLLKKANFNLARTDSGFMFLDNDDSKLGTLGYYSRQY